MKYINKLTFLIAVLVVVISAQLLPSAWRIYYILCLLTILFTIVSILVKTCKQIQLVPGIGKHKDEVDCNLISNIMGNLFWIITIMLAIFTLGEFIYAGFTKTFIWFSVIPIAIYVRIMSKKITKDTNQNAPY